jgi:hypothetical protein
LLALGCRDPVDRIVEVKAADPKRKRILAVFEVWWIVHRDNLIAARDLSERVIKEIDEKAGVRDNEFKYSRQLVARWLQTIPILASAALFLPV